MDATQLNTVIHALIDDLTPRPVPDDDAERRLFHLLDCPRAVDEPALLAVLAAAVTARNVIDDVIAQAVAAAERAGPDAPWPVSLPRPD